MLTKEWLAEHWFTTASVVFYVLANVLPRPSGSELNGPWGVFWRILDRLCFLTSHGLPGSLKPLLAKSPSSECGNAPQQEAEPAKAEPVKAEPVKAEPVKAHPVKARPVKAEPKKEPVAEEVAATQIAPRARQSKRKGG